MFKPLYLLGGKQILEVFSAFFVNILGPTMRLLATENHGNFNEISKGITLAFMQNKRIKYMEYGRALWV